MLDSELSTPGQFEAACAAARPEVLAGAVVLGPDPEAHLHGIEEFVKAGFDHVFVHQVGSEVDGFLRCYRDQVMPTLRGILARVAPDRGA